MLFEGVLVLSLFLFNPWPLGPLHISRVVFRWYFENKYGNNNNVKTS